jgi:hypothetical protein
MNCKGGNLFFLLPKLFYYLEEDCFLIEYDKLSQQKTLVINQLRDIKLSREFCLNTEVLII